MSRNKIVRTFEIALTYDVLIDGNGTVQFPRAEVIPPGAIYITCFFLCNRNFIRAGGVLTFQTTAQVLFSIDLTFIAGQTYQGNNLTPFNWSTSDGSPFFITTPFGSISDGAGIFFIKYTTAS
jgi:hypothetical protein